MLDLFGRGYVIEYCVSSFLELQKEKAYKIYITDCLYSLTNMYATFHGGECPVNTRFAEILLPEKKKEEKTAEEVIDHMRKKLEGKKDGCI